MYVGLAVPVVGVGVAESIFGLRAAGFAFSAIVAAVVLAVLASFPRAAQT